MGYSSLYLFMLMHFFILPSCFHLIILTNSSSSTLQAHHLCLDDERFALRQFNQSLSLDKHASYDPSAYPKVASWKLDGGDCCSWDGVECDDHTGHIIGLDLSSSFLYGSINSSSTLFSLVHLQRLNLADNHFNYSQIPSTISHLSSLSSLNLSGSVFSGQIPSQILGLSKLVSLDLCCNFDPLSDENLLKLEKPSLRSLVQNLTNLKQLSLSHVNISSTVPHTMANLSSLTSLSLRDCSLHGEFPAAIFHLPKLQDLILQFNNNLTGYLPEFNRSSSLRVLKLADTSFSGKLPDSIGNLNSLNTLHLSNCNFSGSLPPSLGNLNSLNQLNLSYCSFSGSLPPSLGNLNSLNQLDLRNCHFSGSLPPSLGNLTLLTYLDLSSNLLQGPIPCSFFKLQNLERLALHFNLLSGTVEANNFFNIQKLVHLTLSYNNITFLTNNITYATLPKFKVLGLSSCNLREFPYFLRFQDELEILKLAENYIHGQIPEWMWNISKETLVVLMISHNFLTGKLPTLLPWVSLGYIDLSHNMLQGSLPIPSPTIFYYFVSNNLLTGKIPPQICHMSFLYALDLSNNDMSGTIPPCIGNFSSSLSVLNLKGNFLGTFHETYTNRSNLRVVDLSQNQLEGKIPRSLENCTMLKILNLGENKMEDTFPFWLGALSELQILILRSNKFYGTIESPRMNIVFPKLRIIDLSGNSFIGLFPLEYFQNWNAMKIVHSNSVAYMQANITFHKTGLGWNTAYSYTISITNKGVKRVYEKILNILTVVDLSSNKFVGEIPESIGNLKGVQLLNLSNNELVGQIPPSLENLINLESLDLSQNNLSGEIPPQLLMLNFLAYLNVSYNNLSGPIPRGKQFDTFQNNSYEGNSALCGEPLSKPCRDPGISTTPSTSTIEQDDDSKFPSGVDWIVIFMGVGSGLVVGFVFGQYITARNHEWFMEKFGQRKLY